MCKSSSTFWDQNMMEKTQPLHKYIHRCLGYCSEGFVYSFSACGSVLSPGENQSRQLFCDDIPFMSAV